MTLMHPKPKRAPKPGKTAAEKRYMAAVAQLSCICCGRIPVEVHHPICGRYSQARAPHWHALPVCDRHHQGKWDTGGPAIHKDRAEWVEWFGPDTDYISETQREIEAETGIEIPAEYRISTNLEGEL